MNPLIPKLTVEESRLLTRVMTLGTGTNLPVVMAPSELAKLIGVVYYDIGLSGQLERENLDVWTKIHPPADYYVLPDSWFIEPIELAPQEHIELMRIGARQIPDFVTYLRCLSDK